MTGAGRAPRSDEELEEALSRPSDALTAALGRIPGDLIVLGAGGKMGPSLARMARRATPNRRVIAVSRWSSPAAEAALQSSGIETRRVDLRDAQALAGLPDAPNVVFMAGQKFGTSGSPAATWAMNAGVPAFVAERYAGARTVVFSTGNVYPLTPPARGGSRESDEPAPVGEYAYSCLARERLFTAASARHGTLVSIVRLNYAHDLRYGVLTDLAVRVKSGQPIDLAMGYVNVIWQGDANALALAALAHATAPDPYVVNVAGPDVLRVADLAAALGARLGVEPVLTGAEAPDALLSNGTRMHELLGEPLLPLDTLLDWVVDWVAGGGTLLGKPTSFEKRDGRF
ncbi:MAG: NAD-dependent epimerase/dehydratase family protein [Gemmatimonadaceae bacterium]|nr:NAD-dependent epimerase/dehydratase family protein [Gemmatimonadaceae bacterium]NUO94721.1 NAD-dependent epimerase/dehydratase family protein [Gemmatimonadaceae bacterium]NUR35587.1 NAD-dependent epimerase/dehydratase family protein [Gemmatimonadaceae bacterium]NUS33133.1 NAD-dependent epimerase/dehydratase family protein [Gemmatimonadaceae bacterium]